ncbi:hypothetical protein HW555_009298 [Spodoptera exigua]|uniref:Nuclear receptor domain-containing protein n=1 Tax=Spodoptera exigua TaxID=7107 RepID=A0A835L6X6_SPOEX|nr:hypothetical protein HW555_009298 [Spodoptera exigua]
MDSEYHIISACARISIRNQDPYNDLTQCPAQHGCLQLMNQKCKVCGEPAAGFHFGAFTCEGCKNCTKVIKQILKLSFTSRPRPLLTSQSNNRNDNVHSIQELRNNWSKAAKPSSHVFAEDRRSTSITAAISWPSVPAATLILRPLLQQPELHHGVQEQRRMCHQQEEPDSLQGVPAAQMSDGRHVQVGSRYGRRSNWFKIHCLLQEQQQAAQSQSPPRVPPSPHPLAPPFPPHLFPGLARPRTKEELALLGLDDYKPPCSASPDSHKSGSSPKLDEKSRLTQSRPPDRPLTPPRDSFVPLHLANIASLPHFPHSPFLPPPPFSPFAHNHPLLFPPGFHPIYSRHLLDQAALRQAAENNNDVRIDDHNERTESSKRFFLDEILKQQRSTQPTPQEDVISETEFVPTPPAERRTSESPLQENPMDLSVKSDGRSSSARRRSDDSEVIVPDNEDGESGSGAGSASEEEDVSYSQIKRIKLHPLDLTTKV